jgi:folylpolyglutamate synthase/dihydropteroate synthase
LAGHIGSLTGEVLSKVFDYRTVDDVGKIATYRKGGVLQNMKTELQVFKQLEESLKGTGVFKELHTVNAGSLLEEMLNVAKKNAQIFDIAHNAQNLTEMKNLLQQNGLTDVLNDLERNVAW